MNIYEIDWRLSSTRQVFQALSDALKNVEKIILDETREDYEREDALEHAENLLGIAFVTAQTYIAGTVSDVNQRNVSIGMRQLFQEFIEALRPAAQAAVG